MKVHRGSAVPLKGAEKIWQKQRMEKIDLQTEDLLKAGNGHFEEIHVLIFKEKVCMLFLRAYVGKPRLLEKIHVHKQDFLY